MRAANFGPEPATARERSVRPVAYSPAFSDDSAAVSTTTWITSPAWGMPMPEKNVTNGDSLEEYAVYGSTSAINVTEPA